MQAPVKRRRRRRRRRRGRRRRRRTLIFLVKKNCFGYSLPLLLLEGLYVYLSVSIYFLNCLPQSPVVS